MRIALFSAHGFDREFFYDAIWLITMTFDTSKHV
jgi:hypothetical protein